MNCDKASSHHLQPTLRKTSLDNIELLKEFDSTFYFYLQGVKFDDTTGEDIAIEDPEFIHYDNNETSYEKTTSYERKQFEISQLQSTQSFTASDDSFDCSMFLRKDLASLEMEKTLNPSDKNIEEGLCLINQKISYYKNKASKRTFKNQAKLQGGKKNKDQASILDNEFEKSPVWSKTKMEELAKSLDLKVSQIYKWHWDRRQTIEHRFKRSIDKINVGTVANSSPNIQKPCIIFRVEKCRL